MYCLYYIRTFIMIVIRYVIRNMKVKGPDKDKIENVLKVLNFEEYMPVNQIVDRSGLHWYDVNWVLHYLLLETDKIERIETPKRYLYRKKRVKR